MEARMKKVDETQREKRKYLALAKDTYWRRQEVGSSAELKGQAHALLDEALDIVWEKERPLNSEAK